MLTFNIAPGSETADFVFPEDIEAREWVGYHGTSSAYSVRIERDGFVRAKPLATNDIQLVADLAKRQGLANADAVAGFLALGSISFADQSALALAFSDPRALGGQGVGFMSNAARELLSGHASAISADEIAELTRIVSWVDDVRSKPAVIYAVDLKDLRLARFNNLTAAIHVFEGIPPSRILARGIVPAAVNHSAIDAQALRDKARATYRSRGSHWLCELEQ